MKEQQTVNEAEGMRKNSRVNSRAALVSSFQSLISRLRSLRKAATRDKQIENAGDETAASILFVCEQGEEPKTKSCAVYRGRKLPKDASRSRMKGARRRGAYLEVCDSRRATEDKEMRSIKELPKDAKLENRNLKLENRKNITAMRYKQNANARSEVTGSVLSVHDPSRATEDKVMRSISWQRGVTLIELMIVLVIILILTVLGTQMWVDQSTRATREGTLTSGNALVKSLTMYKAEWGKYPLVSSMTPLYPYANVTELQSMYTSVTILQTGTAACIQGEVKDIQPAYFVTLCADSDNSQTQTDINNLPTCYWAGKHGWRACKEGL